MISAFTQKLSELETKLDKNSETIEELQCHYEFEWKAKVEKTGEESEESDPEKVERPCEEVRRILLDFQGELKDHSFKVNTLQSRVYCHQEELRSLRTYVQEKVAKEDEIQELQMSVDELRLEVGNMKVNNCKESTRQESTRQKLTRQESTRHQQSPPGPTTTRLVRLNPQVPEFKPRVVPPIVSPPNSASSPKTTETKPKDGETEVNVAPGNMKKPSSKMHEMVLSNYDHEVEDMSFTPELMQQKLFERNQVVLEAERRADEAMIRARECSQNLIWAERRIRILMRDKRSRGETIGKLLRCVDDLKDIGRIDLNTVTAERAILTTTLSTRGMPHEERIQVAINVTEAERLHQYCPDENSPRFGPDGMETSPDDGDLSTSESQCSSPYPNYSGSRVKFDDVD